MLLKSRHRCDNKSFLLFLTCFLFVSSIISEVVSTSSSSVEEEDANFSAENNRNPRDAITLKYGQKLRKKPRKLEVELELPAREEYSHQEEQEQAVPPSSTLPPIKTKHGRVPSKIMVRTHKTTTPEPQQYDDHQTHHQPQEYDHHPQELTTESSIPTWKLYYQNPYISRKPSIPPKKYVFNTSKKVVSTPSVNTRRVPTTSTTTTPHYTFPSYDHSTSTYAPDETTIDPTYYRHSVPEFGVGESRTLSRTLETPPPPPPPTQKVVTTQRTRGKIHSSIKTVSGVRRTTTTTTTEPPPQVYEENTTSSSPNNVESGVEDQKYSNPSISSGEQQDFETTIYYSPSTTTSTSPPTSSTTRRQQPKTKVTTTTTTHRVVSTRPPTQTTVEPTLLREYISHSQPSNVGGIPLKVTTKTFKPIYRVVTEEDAADENERKPELELIRSTSATAPEENETNSTTSTASDNLTRTNVTTTPQEQQAEQLDPSQPTTPAFLKNKVHYIITVIDPPKQGLNSSSNPNATSLSVGENVEEFVEEADEEFSDLLTTPPSTATNRQQGHILAPSSSQESEPFSQLLQRFQSLNIPAPDFINDAINSPSSSSKPSLPQEGRDEQIFHFSSSRPYQQIGSKSVAGSGSSRSNYIVEDNTPFNKVQQQQQNYNSFKLQSVPLRTVVTYQPEPTSRLQDTGALFTDRSVAFYTHLEDGKITKQLLRAPGANNNQNNNDYSTVLPQFLSQFQSPTVREQRSSNNIITNDELRTFPAQSYYLEQQVEPKQHQSGVSRIRTQVVTVDDGGEEYDQDNLRTIPFTVDLVPQ